MSRKRSISTNISLDRAVNDLAAQSDFAALLYTWMIPHAEDDTTITGDPDMLKFTVMPRRMDRSAEDVSKALDLICESGLLRRYTDSRGRAMLQFPPDNFYKYQSYIGQNRRNYKDMRDSQGASSCLPASLKVLPKETATLPVASKESVSGGISGPPPSHPSSKGKTAPPRASSNIVPAHGASKDKPSEEHLQDWALVVDFAQQKLGYTMGIPPVVLDQLHGWHDRGLSSGCLIRAMKEAVENGAANKSGQPKWNYVGTICEKWIEAGVTQVEDIATVGDGKRYAQGKDKQYRRPMGKEDSGVLMPLSEEDKRRSAELTRQLAERMDINQKAVR